MTSSFGAAVGAVVVAAGSGERLGADVPKALVPLAGRALVTWAVEAIAAAGIRQVVVTAPASHLDEVRRACAGIDATTTVVSGGATRSASVRAGLAAIEDATEVIAIHDAARPLQPASVIGATVEALGGDVLAAAPGLPVVDTLKRIGADGRIRGTVDRSELVAIQTPQAFTSDAIRAVHAWAGDRDATDDLALFEQAVAAGALRGRAVCVDGHVDGAKITFADDLQRAAAMLAATGSSR